jgi:hypothetical protein
MKITTLLALAVLSLALGGCSPKAPSYIDALHRSWNAIYLSVLEDGSLLQVDLNTGSGLAVTIAEEEANYLTAILAEKGLTVPEWQKRLGEIAAAPNEFEGGSAAPMSKHLEMLAYLDETIKELRAAYSSAK